MNFLETSAQDRALGLLAPQNDRMVSRQFFPISNFGANLLLSPYLPNYMENLTIFL